MLYGEQILYQVICKAILNEYLPIVLARLIPVL